MPKDTAHEYFSFKEKVDHVHSLFLIRMWAANTNDAWKMGWYYYFGFVSSDDLSSLF